MCEIRSDLNFGPMSRIGLFIAWGEIPQQIGISGPTPERCLTKNRSTAPPFIEAFFARLYALRMYLCMTANSQ